MAIRRRWTREVAVDAEDDEHEPSWLRKRILLIVPQSWKIVNSEFAFMEIGQFRIEMVADIELTSLSSKCVFVVITFATIPAVRFSSTRQSHWHVSNQQDWLTASVWGCLGIQIYLSVKCWIRTVMWTNINQGIVVLYNKSCARVQCQNQKTNLSIRFSNGILNWGGKWFIARITINTEKYMHKIWFHVNKRAK